MDREIGFTYPPVLIVPVCWLNTMRDGTAGHVPGRVTVSAPAGFNQFVVEVTAPALLEYPDDLIVGVLAHEWLHVVHDTIAITARAEGGRQTIDLITPSNRDDYSKSWAAYRRVDGAWQASATKWLSPRLRQCAARVETINVDDILGRIDKTWVSRGLPVETPQLDYEVSDISLDHSIVEHHRQP